MIKEGEYEGKEAESEQTREVIATALDLEGEHGLGSLIDGRKGWFVGPELS